MVYLSTAFISDGLSTAFEIPGTVSCPCGRQNMLTPVYLVKQKAEKEGLVFNTTLGCRKWRGCYSGCWKERWLQIMISKQEPRNSFWGH